MNIILTLSLEQRALANIAITLWSQNDVRDLMSKSDLNMLDDNWQEIEKAVIEKSFKLRLPEKLKEKLLSFIMRMGLQLLSWVDVHHCNYRYVTKLPATFVWTSLGTINNTKTAKLLVMSGTLDDDTSFALACRYCLEDEIKYCWNMIDISLCRSKFKDASLVLYWIEYMQRLHAKELFLPNLPGLLTPNLSFLLKSVKSGNEVATRYFFKVNMENNDFVTAAVEVLSMKLFDIHDGILLQRYSDVMVFLLSKMNVEQQANVIKNYTYAVLRFSLVWPWHNLFLKILEMIKDKWYSLSKNNYIIILHEMVTVMRYETNIRELFEEFWQQSPEAYREYATHKIGVQQVFIGLYKVGDEKNVKMILKDSSISIRKQILQHGYTVLLNYLVSSKKWDSIEFLIQQCLLSLEDLLQFRDVLNCAHRQRRQVFELNEYQLNEFFERVDGYILKIKSCTEYNNASSKKHCVKL